jgi:hypothetical protein
MKNIKTCMVITMHMPKLNRNLHADGSKTYETYNYGYLNIKKSWLALTKLTTKLNLI